MATASNEFKLIRPSSTERYKPSAVTLSCHLSPEISAVNMEIRWFTETDCVCVYKNRHVTEGRGYEGRVSLFTQEMERGNVSLQLRDCRRSDEGHYLCQVTDGERTEEITVEMTLRAALVQHLLTHPLHKDVYVRQGDRDWTEDERVKMEKSALLTDEFKTNIRKLDKTEEELKNTQLELSKSLEHNEQQLEECKRQIENKDIELRNREKIMEEKDALLKDTKTKLENSTEELQEKERALQERDKQLKLKDTQIQEARIQVEEKERRLVEKEKELKEKNEQLTVLKERLDTNEKTLSERGVALMDTNEKLKNATEQIKEKISELENMKKLLIEKETQLKNTDKELETSTNKLETLRQELKDKERQLQDKMIILEQQKTELAEKNKLLEEKESLLTERETQLMERDKQLQEKDRLLEEKTKQLQEQTDPESSAPIRIRNSMELFPPTMSGATQDSAAPIRRRNSMDGGRPLLGGESSSPHSPVSVPVAELRLVLLGRTGSGKSAAGNTILGREERNQAATSTSTLQSESTQGEVAGRRVTVVDTPDWFSPGLSREKLRHDVGHCVHLSAPGPHAFLLVIPVKQPTGEERGMLEKMEDMFGERCWRNTMIIFSVTDELQKMNIEEFIQAGNQEVQRFVEKCENRFHCLNIEESGDGSQVSELLEKIEKMVAGSREKFYSSEIYLETESQITAMETKILKEREEKRMREEMEMKEKIKKEVQDSLSKIEGVIQEHEGDIKQLNDRTSKLERKMKEEKDEEKKRELEKELKREVERRTEMEEKVKKLKEKRERERRKMEERHQQEMEEIREVYEGELRMEAERNLMKIILPELQRNILASKTKMQEEFSRQMEEKNRELESFKQRLSELTEIHRLLEEVYEKTVRRSSEPQRAALTGEASKGISRRFKDFFH